MAKMSKRYRSEAVCAEDLCDPFDDMDGDASACGGSDAAAPRRKNRAVCLMDLPDEGKPSRCRPADDVPRRPVSASKVADWLPPEACDGPCILSVAPIGEGEQVAIRLRAPQTDENGHMSLADCKVYLLVEQYAALRLTVGPISDTKLDAIREAGQLTVAIRRGLQLLQYGDQSARRLSYKLTARGIDRASAEAAADYLAAHGYMHEDSAAIRRAEQGARKLWGPRRIREDLRAAGYPSDAIAEAMEALADVDFQENCLTLLRKKSPTLPADRAARQKLMAAVMRMGYEGDMVRRCLCEMMD